MAEYIYKTGTENGKRVQALGGAKNHMIVLPDADIDMAADALMGAAFGSAGERCMAISVAVAVPVTDRIADALIERLVPKIEAVKIGPAADRSSDVGPLVTRTTWRRCAATSMPGRPRARRSSSTVASSRWTAKATRTAIIWAAG